MSSGLAVRLARLKRSLRVRSEHALRMAAMERVARRHPGDVVDPAGARDGAFWRLVFVPLYERVPWTFKRSSMRALKMTAQGWAEDARQFGEPWRPPAPNGRVAVAQRREESLSGRG